MAGVKNSKAKDIRRRRPRATLPEGGNLEQQRLRSDFGHRLRTAREEKNIGLRELARRLGLSPSLISQIETGKTEPSINTLFAMVSELELSVNEIVFDLERDGDPPSAESDGKTGAARRPRRSGGPGSTEPPGSPVQRKSNRTSISLEAGVSWQRLTAQADHNVDFLLLRYPPGSESTPPHSLMRHNGTEYGYILSGRLEVSLGFDRYIIGPGDSISFDCTEPHRFATVGDETVEAVWFVVGRRNTLSVEDAPADPSQVSP
jgi:transcriptional regulator with XRE-family HTH domain